MDHDKFDKVFQEIIKEWCEALDEQVQACNFWAVEDLHTVYVAPGKTITISPHP